MTRADITGNVAVNGDIYLFRGTSTAFPGNPGA